MLHVRNLLSSTLSNLHSLVSSFSDPSSDSSDSDRAKREREVYSIHEELLGLLTLDWGLLDPLEEQLTYALEYMQHSHSQGMSDASLQNPNLQTMLELLATTGEYNPTNNPVRLA